MADENILAFIDGELAAADAAARRGDRAAGFHHLERAHILAQTSTRRHVRIHWYMLCWALRQRDWPGALGQIPRLAGAAALTAAGWVPKGNTGGTNVSMLRPMPIPSELVALMDKEAVAMRRQGRD